MWLLVLWPLIMRVVSCGCLQGFWPRVRRLQNPFSPASHSGK